MAGGRRHRSPRPRPGARATGGRPRDHSPGSPGVRPGPDRPGKPPGARHPRAPDRRQRHPALTPSRYPGPIESPSPVMTASTPTAVRRRRNLESLNRTNLRGFGLAAVLALLALLAVKLEFKSPDSNDWFYAYGVLVTAVLATSMTVAFGFYRDPALVARLKDPELHQLTELTDRAPLVSCIVAIHNEEDIVRRCVASLVGQT